MARTFNGSTDHIDCAAGGIVALKPGTLAMILRKTGAPGTYQVPVDLGGTAASDPDHSYIALGVGGGDTVDFWDGANDNFTPTIRISTTEGWCLLVVSKAAGANLPRFHKYSYATNSWTHENGTTTARDATTPTGINFGCERDGGVDGNFQGDLACVGLWNVVLTDAQVEALAFTLEPWFQVNPVGLWLFDQDKTTQKVVDLSGNGANESALTGTTVSTSSVPVFNYGGPAVWTPTIVVSVGGGGTIRPVAASAAATSAMTASIAVRRRMAASVVTTSVVTASVSRSRRLATAITTTSFVTTSAHVVRSVTASAVSATSSIIVLLSRPLHLTLFATSAITALVGRTRHASISISATSFMTAEFVRLRSTGTDVAATSDIAASIDVKGLALIVVNAVSATSSLTAHFVRMRSLVASVVGVSPVTATFGKKGAVPLVVAVNAVTSGLTASLARRLRFDASAMASSAVTVSLARTRRLSASVAATSTVTAYAGAQRHLFASAVATSDVVVDLARHKFLEASVVATSFVTSPGFIVVSIGGNFVIATSLRAGRLLGADDLASGSVGFGTGQPGRIFAGGI